MHDLGESEGAHYITMEYVRDDPRFIDMLKRVGLEK
jgi:hypothetical protein